MTGVGGQEYGAGSDAPGHEKAERRRRRRYGHGTRVYWHQASIECR